MFTKLARSIAIREGQKTDVRELNQHFPKFMWLLRDALLQMVDDKGKEIDPTTYLLTKVLRSQADEFEINPTTEETVRKAIVAFFPSIECFALPPPTADVKTMRNIARNAQLIRKDFDDGVKTFIEHLKSTVEVKKAFNSGEPVDGSVLAILTQKFVEAINDPNAIPALDNTWHTVIMLKCKSAQEHLEKEYVDEMTRKIGAMSNGKPLEEDDVNEQKSTSSTTLMGIHRNVFHKKREKLLSEVGRFLGTKLDTNLQEGFTVEMLAEEFETRLVEYKIEEIEDAHGKKATKKSVVGGLLYKFVKQNYDMSFDYCTRVFDELYKPIQDRFVESKFGSYHFNTLIEDLDELDKTYRQCAIGPAKWDVYQRKREMLENEESDFKRLSGYEEKAMQAAEDIVQVQIQGDRLREQLNMIRNQMDEDAKTKEKLITQMDDQHKEKCIRLQEEMRQRQDKEDERYKTFITTKIDPWAERTQKYKETLEKHYGEVMKNMMESLTKQMEKQTEEFLKQAEEIQKLREMLSNKPPSLDG